ncbi:MAG: insulinase family protein [Oscillospiraceae bacterium]|nr:insulinase family protein [Oscillospiraceae bacterium]
MKRELIAPNVHLTQLPNDKFKRNRLSITLILPNEREKATMYALLPGLLERAYEDYPTLQRFSRKLNRMYAAQMMVGTSVVGGNRCLRFTAQGIKNEYCIEGEDLLLEMCSVLLGVMFRPCLENGAFIEEWLQIEKYKLREEIEGEINDKRGYCVKNARRKFFGDHLNGVERLGYLEEIDSITPQQLYDCYTRLLEKAVVEIFITANNADTAAEKLKQAFGYKKDGVTKILPVTAMPCTEVQTYNETMDTTQGKICLVYTTQRLLTEEERYHMLVASALFGGTASSRLFKNVREKQSLCYYCAAGFNGFTSSMSVDSGVEHQNTQRTIDAIQYELDALIHGEITDQEIRETQLTISNSLKANYDGLHGLEAWYLNEAIRGSEMTPEMVIEKANRVTAQDIKNVLKLLNLNVIYTISK